MTLTRRYDEVMERVEVTAEMRGRILRNIRAMDLTAGRGGQFPAVKQALSAAACFAVLLAGVFAAGHMAGGLRPDEAGVAVVNGIVEVDTREQLRDAVGFTVEELDALPFAVETAAYVSYWNEMAEITYTGGGRTATFRKSVGEEDNSGDYNLYSAVREIRLGSLTATLKGSGEAYTLAVWSADGYAYSVRLSDGITELEWRRLIGG